MRAAARVLRRFLAAALVLAVLWGGGLVWFVARLGAASPDPGATADAIVVLTGGSRRLEAGLALLEAGKGKKLFLSGVARGVSVDSVLRQAPEAERFGACCIVLGHAAADTIGNAAETAEWLAAEDYHSFHLVTADYHMERALLEFRRVLPPSTGIIPDPVVPEGGRRGLARVASRVVVVEYCKYLGAVVRTLILPARAAA